MSSTPRTASGSARNVLAALILGASIAYGLGAIGRSLAGAVQAAHAAQRTVTVKGLSEREVAADLAIWPLTFVDTSSDLIELQHTLDAHRGLIIAFLKARGFEDKALSESAPSITDLYAQDPNAAAFNRPRYSALATVTLHTSRVKEVDAAVRHAGDLVKQGIVLSGGYGAGAQYFFTGLNQVKPSMIVEATQSARKAAEQFAKDSHSRVGSIRTAQQGLFSIEDRDQYTPELKKVRVVTTVDYFLVGE